MEVTVDKNPIAIGVGSMMFFLLVIGGYLLLRGTWTLERFLEICGVIFPNIGSIWLASGIYLSSKERQRLANLIETLSSPPATNMDTKEQQFISKNDIGWLASLIGSSSNTATLGIIYVFVGMLLQLLSLQ